MADEVSAMGTGHWATADEPLWYLVHEPTAAQVADAVKVADHKVHRGIDTFAPYPGPLQYYGGWHWWLLVNKRLRWTGEHSEHKHASVFNPDAGRKISPGKHHYTRPGALERPQMKQQGERALHKFIDGLDATNAERAAILHNVAPVAMAVEYGDLPAAVHAALGAGLNSDLKGDLVGLLEDEMIYWPDFQRPGSTSADRTIAHHVPAGAPSNSGTSLTISGTNPSNSGTSLTISASVTTSGGATG